MATPLDPAAERIAVEDAKCAALALQKKKDALEAELRRTKDEMFALAARETEFQMERQRRSSSADAAEAIAHASGIPGALAIALPQDLAASTSTSPLGSLDSSTGQRRRRSSSLGKAIAEAATTVFKALTSPPREGGGDTFNTSMARRGR